MLLIKKLSDFDQEMDELLIIRFKIKSLTNIPRIQFDKVKTLIIRRCGLVNLNGIEKFVNLKCVNCSNNQINNIRAIMKLDLDVFYCQYNRIDDFSPIYSTFIKSVKITWNKVKDFRIANHLYAMRSMGSRSKPPHNRIMIAITQLIKEQNPYHRIKFSKLPDFIRDMVIYHKIHPDYLLTFADCLQLVYNKIKASENEKELRKNLRHYVNDINMDIDDGIRALLNSVFYIY